MRGKPQIDGCRVVALGDAWAYGQGQITWNELEALAHAAPAEAHCATCSCVPGMTPAIRFDTTPAEHDGAVRDHLIRMGWTPPAEAQADREPADWPHQDWKGMDGAIAWHLIDRHASGWEAVGEMMDAWLSANSEQPPSAPVGVEGREAAEHDQFAAIVNALHEAGESIERAVVLARGVTEALAQQPAAPRNSSGHCPDSSGHSRVESILLRAGFNPDEAARIAARAVQQGGATR